MEITKVSMISKKENTLEFIVSGITKDEWDNVFGDE